MVKCQTSQLSGVGRMPMSRDLTATGGGGTGAMLLQLALGRLSNKTLNLLELKQLLECIHQGVGMLPPLG